MRYKIESVKEIKGQRNLVIQPAKDWPQALGMARCSLKYNDRIVEAAVIDTNVPLLLEPVLYRISRSEDGTLSESYEAMGFYKWREIAKIQN
jgi:hypothetical protein